MILANIVPSAPPEFTGNWVFVSIMVLQAISLLFGLAGYVATRREVDKMDARLLKLEQDALERPERMNEMANRLDRSDEARISGIHNRLNPMEKELARNTGHQEAFTQSFEKFTRIIEATSRQRDDQINAFTRALETFASVLEQRKQ